MIKPKKGALAHRRSDPCHAFIAYNWIRKDIWSVYSDVPAEQILPLVVTTVGVTLLKVALIAFGV